MQFLRLLKAKIKKIFNAAFDAALPRASREARYRKIDARNTYRGNADILSSVLNNTRFQNIHKGKRCFIVGNGPSLKETDLRGLENEICFTVNYLNRSSIFDQLQTSYHVLADPAIFRGLNDLSEEVITNPQLYEALPPEQKTEIDLLTKLRHSVKHPTLFVVSSVLRNAGSFLEKFGIDIAPMMVSQLDLLSHAEYTADLTQPLPPMHNVVQYAITIALYMGFSEIYLVGCDATDFLNEAHARLDSNIQVHAYEELPAPSQEVLDKGSVEASFRSFYSTFRDYRRLNEYCQRNHVSFVNCTVGGILDSMPRCPLQTVLSSKQ